MCHPPEEVDFGGGSRVHDDDSGVHSRRHGPGLCPSPWPLRTNHTNCGRIHIDALALLLTVQGNFFRRGHNAAPHLDGGSGVHLPKVPSPGISPGLGPGPSPKMPGIDAGQIHGRTMLKRCEATRPTRMLLFTRSVLSPSSQWYLLSDCFEIASRSITFAAFGDSPG